MGAVGGFSSSETGWSCPPVSLRKSLAKGDESAPSPASSSKRHPSLDQGWGRGSQFVDCAANFAAVDGVRALTTQTDAERSQGRRTRESDARPGAGPAWPAGTAAPRPGTPGPRRADVAAARLSSRRAAVCEGNVRRGALVASFAFRSWRDSGPLLDDRFQGRWRPARCLKGRGPSGVCEVAVGVPRGKKIGT